MAGSHSDYLEKRLLDSVYGSGDPATIYVHLYTVAPTDAGGGTEVSTDDWSNYAPAAVTNNPTNWPAAAGESPATKSNGVAISFGTATIVAPPTVVAWATKDGSGNQLDWADVTTPKEITDGDPVSFPIGSLVVTEA